MAMAERLVGSQGYLGKVECGLISSSKPAGSLARCEVKGLGWGAALSSPVLRLQQGRARRNSGRNAGREVRSVLVPLKEEVAPKEIKPTQYNDSWIEVAAVEFLTRRMGAVIGKTTDLKGYDGFVDMTRKLVHGLPASKQRETVHELLHVVLPGWLLFTFRVVPKTKFIKEFYAQFTKVFFRWLVGDCEIREAEINGVLMKSTVHIKKCRYLENSQCVGLCTNLCKNPTQDFIGKQFGMPLTMNPNFEDMSCDMIYGLNPPPLEEDTAYQQPCYTLCKTAKTKPNCAT